MYALLCVLVLYLQGPTKSLSCHLTYHDKCISQSFPKTCSLLKCTTCVCIKILVLLTQRQVFCHLQRIYSHKLVLDGHPEHTVHLYDTLQNKLRRQDVHIQLSRIPHKSNHDEMQLSAESQTSLYIAIESCQLCVTMRHDNTVLLRLSHEADMEIDVLWFAHMHANRKTSISMRHDVSFHCFMIDSSLLQRKYLAPAL
jgi:hypothetical protein